MQSSPIQTNFLGGEITPRMHGRVDLDLYATALAECVNFIPQIQGSVRMRAGSQFAVEGDNTDDSVLATFRRNIGNDFVIEIGPSTIVPWARSGRFTDQPVDDVSGNLYQDPQILEGGAHWYWDKKEYLTGTHNEGPRTGLPIRNNARDAFYTEFTGGGFGAFTIRAGHVDETAHRFNMALKSESTVVEDPKQIQQPWSESLIQRIETPTPASLHNLSWEAIVTSRREQFIIGSIGAQDAPHVPTMAGSMVELRIGTTDGGDEILNQQFSTPEESLLYGFNTTFTPNVSPFYVTMIPFADSPPDPKGVSGSVAIGQFLLTTVVTGGGTGLPISFTSPYTIDQIHDLQWDMDSANGELWIAHPNVETQRLKFNGSVWSLTALSAIPGFTAPTGDPWQGASFPRAVAIHEGRLWLGGAPNQPSTVWASQTGVYHVFTPSTNPDDPLEFPLATSGVIEWVRSHKSLVIGTDINEYIGISDGGVITQTDFAFLAQSHWGSAPVIPADVGRELMYVMASRRKIRSFSDFGDTINGYDGEEVTLQAEHLVAIKILDIAYADDPNYQLVALTSEGDLASCTYVKDMQVSAWHQITTQGSIRSITVTSDVEGTSLWASIWRNDAMTIELFNPAEFSGINVDSHVVRGVPANKIITGLDHLEGLEVTVVIYRPDSIVTDDNELILEPQYQTHPDRTVESGQITLESWAEANVFVGLNYEARLVTLKSEGTSNVGTAQVDKRRYNRIYARLLRSALPIINGTRPPERDPQTPMDTSQPFTTGDVDVRSLGYDDGVIVIEQDLPLNTEIVATFGRHTGDRF